MSKQYVWLTPWEQRYIFDNAGKITVRTMAAMLNCNPKRIEKWAYTHGLSLRVKGK